MTAQVNQVAAEPPAARRRLTSAAFYRPSPESAEKVKTIEQNAETTVETQEAKNRGRRPSAKLCSWDKSPFHQLENRKSTKVA